MVRRREELEAGGDEKLIFNFIWPKVSIYSATKKTTECNVHGYLPRHSYECMVLKLRLQFSATPPWKALLSDRSPLSTMHKESIQKLGKLYLKGGWHEKILIFFMAIFEPWVELYSHDFL